MSDLIVLYQPKCLLFRSLHVSDAFIRQVSKRTLNPDDPFSDENHPFNQARVR